MSVLHEPAATALLLLVIGALLGVSALFSRAASRAGVPLGLLFIGVGLLVGVTRPLGFHFDDPGAVFRLGTIALVVILFDGGLNTPEAAVRKALAPAALLATVGVLVTAGIVAVGAWALGFETKHALLLGATVASTDAAAVFGVLRGRNIPLERRTSTLLELESGLNDPLAVVLTLAITGLIVSGEPLRWTLALSATAELAIGAAVGLGVGYAGRALLHRVPLQAGGLYPVLTLALAFVTYGTATMVRGSGFLAVYIAAVLLGNEAVRYRSGLLRVHDALAWLAQVGLFLALGLLAKPAGLLAAATTGLALALLLAFAARPIAVALSLLPFRLPLRQVLYIGWVGLRGGVPVLLATFPILAGAPGAEAIFHTVFFIVVVNALIPGATVEWVTRHLGLIAQTPPPPPAVLEVTSTQLLEGELTSFFVAPASAVAGATVADLPFPEHASMALIVRGNALVPPRGNTLIQGGDHVYVTCRSDDLPLLQLLFGVREED
ncbi:MAG: potassium/proton antiporter [Myxococcaceae bacterium]